MCVRNGLLQVEKANSGAGGLVEVLEAKGLDMVRRDWSTLSKDTGNYVLQQILSGMWPAAQQSSPDWTCMLLTIPCCSRSCQVRGLLSNKGALIGHAC
jgi:hypothetical protein